MADFLDRMMVGINKGASTISEGSKNLMEKAKLNTAIHDAEEAKKKLAELLGQQAFNLYMSGTAIPEELHNFCLEIKKRNDEIRQYQESLAALEAKRNVMPGMPQSGMPQGGAPQGGVACGCGFTNNPGAKFCAKCGNKLG